LARGLNSLPTSSTCAISAESPFRYPRPNRWVAARTGLEAWRERVEQLGDHRAVLQVLHDEATGVQGLGGRVACGHAALRDRDQPFNERPKLLRTRNRRDEVLVPEKSRGLVPQHRDAMLGDATQLAVCYSVSHVLMAGGSEGQEGQAGIFPTDLPVLCRRGRRG
jgi:hypothetical protein